MVMMKVIILDVDHYDDESYHERAGLIGAQDIAYSHDASMGYAYDKSISKCTQKLDCVRVGLKSGATLYIKGHMEPIDDNDQESFHVKFRNTSIQHMADQQQANYIAQQRVINQQRSSIVTPL